MKKNLLIFPIVGAILLTICLAGCDKTPNPTVPSDSNVESTNPGTNPDDNNDATSIIDTNNPFIQDTDIAMGTQFVWEKEHQVLNANSIRVNSDWESYIMVGENKITANQMSDASVLNNYFYKDNELSIADDMKMAYELNWRDFHVRAKTAAPNALANGELIIRASTYPTQSKVLDKYDRHLIIHSVQYNSCAAEIEEILNALREIKVDSENVWGIGSTYEDVVQIMGEPDAEHAENVFEHSMLITSAYQRDNCTMTITFFTDTATNKGFVIGLTWDAAAVSNQLCSQEGYQDFYSGVYSDLQFEIPEIENPDDANENESADNNDVAVQ